MYDLFVAYEAWKRVFDAYDVMDAVHHIYAELRRDGYRGDAIHEAYVDEVQDFTQARLVVVALMAMVTTAIGHYDRDVNN